MAQAPTDFMPLDPGRIHADDPMEIDYWSTQLGCTPALLADLVAVHGEHVTVVRAVLASQPSSPPDHTSAQPRGRR